MATHRLVNVCGPLGVGKTHLVEQLADVIRLDAGEVGDVDAGRRCLVIDGVDGPARLAAAVATADSHRGPLVVVSRQPLFAERGWTGRNMVVVHVKPLSNNEIHDLVAESGIVDRAERELIARLAVGIPLLALAAVRALHGGASADAPGAVADHIAVELFELLERESPGRRWQYALRLLATAGTADETVLAGGPDLFTRVSRLSVVGRGQVGLVLREPYRGIVELAFRWRRPESHRNVRVRAEAHTLDRLRGPVDAGERAALVEQAIFLAATPPIRSALFPSVSSVLPILQATDADADDIARLMREWAHHNDFRQSSVARMVEGWADADITSYHLVRNDEGRLVGLANLMPITDRTADSIDPLLQQYADEIIGKRMGGLFLGAAFSIDPAVHPHILRHTLRAAASVGELVVSTANPEYLALLRGLRFDPHGALRDDVYRSGRAPEVYSNDFAAAAGQRWLARVTGRPAEPHTDRIAFALSRIHDAAALAESSLLESPVTPSVPALRRWLRAAVAELADSADPVTAETGTILAAYYLRPSATHRQVASRLHLSRATYFRRLGHGLALVATRHAHDGG